MKTNLPSRRQTLCNLGLAAAMAPFAGSPFLRAWGKEPKLSLNQAIADVAAGNVISHGLIEK